MLLHALVDGTGAEAATYEQDGLLIGIEAELFACILRCDIAVHHILPHGVAGLYDLVGREETLHAVVGHTDDAGLGAQHLVGLASVGVLLLDEAGHAETLSGIQCCCTGVTAYAHSHLRLKRTHDLLCQTFASEVVDDDANILWRVEGTRQSPDGQAFDLIASLWHTLHLHAAQCADKQYLRVGVLGHDGIGNAYCGKDVAASTASANDDS